MIELTLTDATTTATLQLPEVPLVIADSNKDVQNTTLDNTLAVFIYPNADRLIITQNWAYMSIDDYDTIRGFRQRQRASGDFPKLSITGLKNDIIDLTVYLEMGDRNIVDNCETLNNVQATFRGV